MNLKFIFLIWPIITVKISSVTTIRLNTSQEGHVNLIPLIGASYFLDDNSKPVLGLFDGVDPFRSEKSYRKNIHYYLFRRHEQTDKYKFLMDPKEISYLQQFTSDQSERNSINFHLFTRKNPYQSYQLFVDDIQQLKRSPFNPSYQTKMIIHGFSNSIEGDFVQNLKNAYMENKQLNVIAVDWGTLCKSPWYNSAVTNTMAVGKYTAKLVDLLVDEMKLNLKDLHIIGHSLGAHTAGIVGNHIKSSGQISRITGLDPALPLYDKAEMQWLLTPDDSKFVDVIHTSGGHLGILQPLGHIDFYPNGGVVVQPGCSYDITASCSHSRAWEFYVETVKNKDAFPTAACENLFDAMFELCDSYGFNPNMGEHAYLNNKFKTGIFYTKTNEYSPFARNERFVLTEY